MHTWFSHYTVKLWIEAGQALDRRWAPHTGLGSDLSVVIEGVP